MAFITPALSNIQVTNSVARIVPNKFLQIASRTGSGWRWILLLALLLSWGVWAAGFQVTGADTRLVKGVYHLDARIEYDFSEATMEALRNGVPLTIQLQMEVLRRRDWLWDETVASLQQRFRLEYHALARQYLVTNLNSGALHSFPTQGTALEYLGRINGFPFLDKSLLHDGERYYARLRARLDIEALPAPLRLTAYLSKNWRLTSEWYVWPL